MNKNIMAWELVCFNRCLLGAFGAHALKELLSSNQLASFETEFAIKYFMELFFFLLDLLLIKFILIMSY